MASLIGNSGPHDCEENQVRQRYARRNSADSKYSWFTPSHLFLMQNLEKRLLELLARSGCLPISTKKILEVGCGTGFWVRDFLKWGARPENIIGVDLLFSRLSEARRMSPERLSLVCGSASALGFPSDSFDIVFQSTVFTSILNPQVRKQMAQEMLRVLKPGGVILWYDFHVNNPRNPDVLRVRRQEILQLFSGCQIQLRRITLAPPITRWVARRSWLACHLLEKIPWLCTHYLGAIHKMSAGTPGSASEI
jgi:ubiquinone/menaquinone biosynthesis C-methylase UbiE